MNDPSLNKRKSLGGCATAFLALAVLLLLVLCLFWVWTIRCDRLFAKQIEEIQQRGEPASPEEMEAFYALPEGAFNTTDLVVNATRALANSSFMDPEGPVPIVGDSDEVIPAVGSQWKTMARSEAYLDQHTEQIEMLHEAARKGGAARFNTNFADGFNMLLADLQNTRQGSRALQLAARVHAHRGETDKVAECLHAMISLGESPKNEPIVVSQLVRTAMVRAAVLATAVEIHEVAFTDAQLKKLQEEFRKIDFDEGYRRAMMGERAMGILALGSTATAAPSDKLMKIVKQDTGEYFSIMEQSIDVMNEPYTEAKYRFDAEEQRVQNLRGPRHIMTKLIVPALGGSVGAKARGTAMVRMIDAALAVKRFELAKKHLPKTLEELTPDFLPSVPDDPFDDGRVRYIPDPDGVSFLLYCVGEDGLDDGGKTHVRGGVDARDVVLRVGAKDPLTD